MATLGYRVGRAVRETGQALDRVGLSIVEKPVFKEPFARHRPVMNLYDKFPAVENNAFVAPNATVVGRVAVGPEASIWYGAVVRGDASPVTIGARAAIKERAVISTVKSVEGHAAAHAVIGDNAIIGPGALLCSCIVESDAEIGAGAIVLEGAVVEAGAIVEPGAVVHAGRRVPAGEVWGGNPATFVRALTKEELATAGAHAADEAAAAEEHAEQFLPYTTVYNDAERVGVDALEPHLAKIRADAAAAARAAGEKA